MQSSFSTLKSGLADWFDNFGETKMEVFDYMEAIRTSGHSRLGQISPAAFERRTTA